MYFIPSTVIIVTCTKLAIRIVQPFSVDLSYLTRSLRKRRENNKRKVAKMVIVIAVAFILTWSPHYLVSITSVLQKSFHKTHIFDKENYVFTMLMTYFFGLANSCMNPLIYNAMSTAFKRRFRATLRRLFCRPFARLMRNG
uniref:G-protein coupled receptor 54 n=1 Tax=Magallana gigas TaxID=29159 RepID=K1PMX5_MAGGI